MSGAESVCDDEAVRVMFLNERLEHWLNKQRFYTNAKEALNTKKNLRWMRWKGGGSPYPFSVEEEIFIRLNVIACRGLYTRSNMAHVGIARDLPKKIVSLSQELLNELEEVGMSSTLGRTMRTLASGRLPEDGIPRRPYTSNELRKEVTLTIGREMKRMFGFRHTRR